MGLSDGVVRWGCPMGLFDVSKSTPRILPYVGLAAHRRRRDFRPRCGRMLYVTLVLGAVVLLCSLLLTVVAVECYADYHACCCFRISVESSNKREPIRTTLQIWGHENMWQSLHL
jgi:hypothetical protein